MINKPKGWTSFDVVNKVRSVAKTSPHNTSNKKRYPVGHTGTLDPLATGLLVLMLGDYTKRAPGLTKLDKTYEVVMKLGQTSTTGDDEGEKTDVSDKIPTLEEVQTALSKFVGDIMQIPPVYSAIKIDGKRAYKLAREGKAPEMQPRPTTIHKIEKVTYDYPFVNFVTEVSGGTYVRSLVEDVGNVLGTGAYMSDLCRTRVGEYDLADATAVESLDPETLPKLLLA